MMLFLNMNKYLKYGLIVAFLGACMIARWYMQKEGLDFYSKSAEVVESLGEETTRGEKVESLTQYARYFDFLPLDAGINGGQLNILQYANADRSDWKVLALDSESELEKSTVVCLSSVFVGYLAALDLEDRIVGVDNLDFISNDEVKRNPEVAEVGNVGSLNLELLFSLNPTYVLVDDFDLESGLEKKLELNKIKLIKCNSFREESPLARAEWIKFFGLLFGKRGEAENLFKDTEFKYHLLKSEAKNFKDKPTVIMNVMWGDQWTIPGGNSFQAKLMQDAGADYLFKYDTTEMTIHTGLESMLSKANNADYWLNLGSFSSKEALLESNVNYGKFKAFKEGNLFNNNKGVNRDGGIPYWETSAVYPEWVLEDLLNIFHPQNNPEYKFYFYQKLK